MGRSKQSWYFSLSFPLFISFLFLCFCAVEGDIASDALSSLESFLEKYWDESANYLYKNYPNNLDRSLSEYWNFAECYETVLNGIILTDLIGNSQANAQLWTYCENFYLGQSAIGWNRDYYDDMNWMTMSLMKAYFLSSGKVQAAVEKEVVNTIIGHDLSKMKVPSYLAVQPDDYLSTAEGLYQQIMDAWDTTCCGNLLGGIWWDTAHTQKATAANAGPVIAGVYLYLATNNGTYLSFAEQVYSFWRNSMVNNSTFQVADHFDTQGNIVWWKYTYNEGLMISASIALHKITQDPAYLQTAQSIGNFMASSETIATSYGPVLNDGDNSQCTSTDCPQFKMIGFTGLYTLNQVSPSPTFQNVISASVNGIWNNAQLVSEQLFATAWQGPPPNATIFNNAQESAAVSPLLLCARPPSCI